MASYLPQTKIPLSAKICFVRLNVFLRSKDSQANLERPRGKKRYNFLCDFFAGVSSLNIRRLEPFRQALIAASIQQKTKNKKVSRISNACKKILFALTYVGLEPTASRLEVLRATIAPAGHDLIKIC